MRLRFAPSCALILGLVLPYSLAAADLVWGETLEQTAKRTGYTTAEIKKYFPPLNVKYRLNGMAKERFHAPPAPYIHPRIFFNPEDVPALQKGLRETVMGRRIWTNLQSTLKETLLNPASKLGRQYQQLQGGDLGIVLADRDHFGLLLAQESYRCLIEGDSIGGRRAAAVLTAVAGIVNRELAGVNPTYEWQYKTGPMIAGDAFARAYDFTYNWMDDAQRQTVRAMLAGATAGKWSIGMDALPAWEANMMNWSTWVSGQLLVSTLAIEGEKGYDATLYPRLTQMYRQMMELGFFESGAGYEGMAKNSPMLRYQIALAKRGDFTIAQTHTRSFVDHFRLHTMEPWGFNWLEDGNWGGAETRGHLDDYMAMKWAFPDDLAVDFQFRNAMDAPGAEKAAVYPEMFPVDWNRSITWEQELQQLTQHEPTTFFCNDLGLLVARSSWKPDAALLYFVPRNLLDGHRHANRNMFVFSALGRVWADYTKNAGGSFEGDITESSFHSVVLIDDVGQALGPPAKFVAMVDKPEATFGVGDARLAYSVRRSNHGETSLELHPNDFRLEKSPLPWMDLAWKDLPDWFSGQKLAIGDYRNRFVSRRPPIRPHSGSREDLGTFLVDAQRPCAKGLSHRGSGSWTAPLRADRR